MTKNDFNKKIAKILIVFQIMSYEEQNKLIFDLLERKEEE